MGVDPGTLITGYGVIKKNGTSMQVLDVGVIKISSSDMMPLRLKRIYASLCAIIERFHPDEFAIETAFIAKMHNPR
jgi:crossover junction endodeoxyribonuclease RuvC